VDVADVEEPVRRELGNEEIDHSQSARVEKR
jgi:hypothetical protein